MFVLESQQLLILPFQEKISITRSCIQYKICLSYKTFLQRSCKVQYVNYRNNGVARVTGPANWFIRLIHLQSLPIVFVSSVLIIAIVYYKPTFPVGVIYWYLGVFPGVIWRKYLILLVAIVTNVDANIVY